MKKIILALSMISVFGLASAQQTPTGSTFNAYVQKFAPRGFDVKEVTTGESNIKKIFTSNCPMRIREGSAHISLNEYNQGYITLAGVSCVVVSVERLAPGEEREKFEKRKKDNSIKEINAPSFTPQFYNNISNN